MTKHLINIERLTPDTVIYLRTWSWAGMTAPFNDTAIVEDIEFDGHGYALTLDCGDRHYVDAGQIVEFGGVGEPVLRDEDDVGQDELDAKTWAMIDLVDANRGCVSRNVDAQLVSAVADAVGVEFQAAAE